MIKKISKTDEIDERLRRDGKVEILDKPEHRKAIRKLNELMQRVHREYLIKSARSEQSAREVVVC